MIINVSPDCVLASAVFGLARHGDDSICHVSVRVTLVQLIPVTLLQTQVQSLPLLFGFNRELCLHLLPVVLNMISLLTCIRNVPSSLNMDWILPVYCMLP